MFTGLIEETGSVLWIRATDRGTQLQLSAPRIAGDVQTGESISVNGCCLTVESHRHELITFDLLEETVARTNLGALKPDSVVNLERALVADARLGGHFVQGHIDCTASIIDFAESDSRLEIALPEDRARVCGRKGINRSQRDQLNRCRSEAGELCHLDHSAYPSSHQLNKCSGRRLGKRRVRYSGQICRANAGRARRERHFAPSPLRMARIVRSRIFRSSAINYLFSFCLRGSNEEL